MPDVARGQKMVAHPCFGLNNILCFKIVLENEGKKNQWKKGEEGGRIANEEIDLVSMLNQGEFDLASKSMKAKGKEMRNMKQK